MKSIDKKVAIQTDTGVRITYKSLRKEVMKLSRKLECHHVAIILCSNTVGFIYSYLSCLKSRVVPLLLSTDISDEQLEGYICLYDAGYLCVPSERNLVKKIGIEVEVSSVHNYIIYKRATDNTPLHRDLMLLLTTSGSTGGSKCVRLSRKNVIHNTRAICTSLKIQSEDRAITSLPMNYTYGLSVIHTHLYRGATILLTESKALSPEFWTFFDKEKGTSFAGVPFMYDYLYKLKVFEKEHKSLRVLTQAGGKLSDSLQKYYGELSREAGYQFIIMYGQTEATARMSYLPPHETLKRMGSVGIPISGGRFEIISDEIVYHGENVSLGYAESKADLRLGDDNQGVLYTGDLGYVEKGFLYITGRKDRYIKVNGVRIFLPELEKGLQQKFHREIVCLMKKDILYFIHEGNFSEKEWQLLLVWTKEKIPVLSHQLVDMTIKHIPRTEVGKVDYFCLQNKINKIYMGERDDI